jgi:ribonuclease Z
MLALSAALDPMRFNARILKGLWLASLVLVGVVPHTAAAQTADDSEIIVTLLGTGSPALNPARFGPSTLVQAGGKDLVFDAGRGLTIRMAQVGVQPGDIDALFITHFQSDHVNGFSDLWMAGYMLNNPSGGRQAPLHAYGGLGMKNMADNMAAAFSADTIVRTEGRGGPPGAADIMSHEIENDGVVFEQDGVTVTAFAVSHIPHSYGYRVDYRGRSVLISGDTKPDPNLIKHGDGVDLLIHQVRMAPPGTDNGNHTFPEEAGEIFRETSTKMGVYSHIITPGFESTDPDALAELEGRTRATYDGPLALGVDLLRFVVGDRIEIDQSFIVD